MAYPQQMDVVRRSKRALHNPSYVRHSKGRKQLEANEKIELEKAAKKKANDTARTLCINQKIASRVFDQPLAFYKRKDDLIVLAVTGALALSMEGAVVELVNGIKGHLAENPGRADEPRFGGLGGSRKRTAAVPSSPESSVEPPTPAALLQSSASSKLIK